MAKDPKHIAKDTRVKETGHSSPDLDKTEHPSHLMNTKQKAESPTSKHQWNELLATVEFFRQIMMYIFYHLEISTEHWVDQSV